MSGLEPAVPGQHPKVLVVLRRFDVGGTEKHTLRVLPELARRGIDVSVYLLERGGRLEPELVASGIKIFGPNKTPRGFVGRLLGVFPLIRHLRQQRPDIVHFYLAEAYLIGTLAAMLAGVRNRIMSRRSLATYQKRHPIIAVFEKWLHRFTPVLLGNSHPVLDELERECGDRSKIGLIYNGIELPTAINADIRASARKQLDIPEAVFVLTVVANLLPYKGHADLLAALAIIRDRLPAQWRLIAVGRDDGLGQGLKLQAERSGLADHVTWAGEQANVDPFFNAADVTVLCSYEEGLSNSLIEAMGRGLPAVASALGGNVDAVAPGETGLLVPAKTPEALAAAILRLAEDPQLRSRFGAAGRQRVQKLFTLEGCVQRHANLYTGLARASRVPVQSIIDGLSTPQ